MDQLTSLASPLARLFLALPFIGAGLGKLGDMAGTAGYMQSAGVPAFLAWPSTIYEIVAGVLVLVGFSSRIAALTLAGFCLLTGLLFHFVPSDVMQMTMFLKNLAMAGGFLLLAVHGPGRWAFDAASGGTPALTSR